jgi:hypothetical protein
MGNRGSSRTSDPDDIDEVLRDLRRFAEKAQVSPLDSNAFPGVPQIEGRCDFAPEDELILGDDYVTYLIFADEHEITDFSISTEGDCIEVKTVDFTLKKELGMRVDTDGADTTYSNGVLSVKLKRIGHRDAVG